MTTQLYYVARITGQDGPLTVDEVQRGVLTGRYGQSDLTWQVDGDNLWIPLADRPELAVVLKPDKHLSVDATSNTDDTPTDLPEIQARPATFAPDVKPMPPELASRLTPEQWQMAQRAAVAWRRFLARSVDLGFAGLLYELVRGADLQQPEVPSLPVSLLIVALWPWLEALLISTVGNTPGKALLRLRVVNLQGERPHFMQSLMRSVWVWIQGMALGLPIASQVAHVLAFNTYTRSNRTLWDIRAGTEVLVLPISQLRMTLIVAVFIGSAVASVMLASGRL